MIKPTGVPQKIRRGKPPILERRLLVPNTARGMPWPEFFGGHLRMLIVAATARWGPLNLSEIERCIDMHQNTNTGKAARYLQEIGVLVMHVKSIRRLKVELDRRHPCYEEIRDFGRALYKIYIEPLDPPTPEWRRKYIGPTEPKHDPATLDMHVLGDKAQMRLLHLLSEGRKMAQQDLFETLGLSHRSRVALQDLEDYGILKSKFGRGIKYLSFNTAWPPHRYLHALLVALSPYLSEYHALYEAYKATPYYDRLPSTKARNTRRRSRAF